MTTFHIGINGFDRLSRVFLRTCIEYTQLQVTAINDPNLDLKYICYLIKYDSTHGNFKGSVKKIDNGLLINGKRIEVFHNKEPECIPWFLADVDYVIETTGQYTSLKLASLHLASNLKVKRGVKRVLVTVPSKDIPVIILGVNHDELTSEMKVVSCASSTLYCLAPITKVLDDHFGVVEGMMSSVHALTPSLKSLDGKSTKNKHWREHRGSLQNIIPAPSGACRTLGRVLPHLDNKLCGLAYRIPVSDVSLLDLTIRLEKSTSLSEIKQRVEEASKSHMQGIIIISEEETVSSDYKRNKHSCIIDCHSSLALNQNFYKLVCWYDNEYSYACRIAELIIYAENPSCRPPTLRKSKTSKDQMRIDFVEPYKSQMDVYNYGPNIKVSNVIPIIRPKQHIDRNLSSFRICECFKLGDSETHTSNMNQTISMLKQTTDINSSLRTRDSGCCTAEVQELPEAHSCNQNKTGIDKDYNIGTDSSEILNTHENFILKHKYHKSDTDMENGHSDMNIFRKCGSSLNDKQPILKDISSSEMKFKNCFQLNEPGHGVVFQIESLTKSKVTSETKEGSVEIKKQQNKICIDETNTLSDIGNVVEGDEEESIYFVGEPKRGGQRENKKSMMSKPTRLQIEEEKDSINNALLRNIGMRKETPAYNINNNMNYIPLETLSELKPYTSPSTSSKGTDVSPTYRNRGGSSIALSDKLESASDNDSVFSFKMLDKNSTEIKFCDITDSLDDLEKLNNICKIIEISNELSDNLFVKLENEQNPNTTSTERVVAEQEWSLKKFCEKVELDNFFKPPQTK